MPFKQLLKSPDHMNTSSHLSSMHDHSASILFQHPLQRLQHLRSTQYELIPTPPFFSLFLLVSQCHAKASTVFHCASSYTFPSKHESASVSLAHLVTPQHPLLLKSIRLPRVPSFPLLVNIMRCKLMSVSLLIGAQGLKSAKVKMRV